MVEKLSYKTHQKHKETSLDLRIVKDKGKISELYTKDKEKQWAQVNEVFI